MVVCGISYSKGTSKKTGEPYEAYILHGLSRRFNGDVQAESVWISPQEYARSGVKVGDSVRFFRDGGILIQDFVAETIDFVSLVS